MFFLLVLLDVLIVSYASNGVIWSKKYEDFVPLFSISAYLHVRNEYINKSRKLEFHNFQKKELKIAYFQEKNLVSFCDNDTKITGVCGELWNMLADYLNFTLIPIRLKDRNFGIELENGSYDGLLGLIQKNETQIIPRSGVFESRLSLVDYTIPLWSIRYHLYMKPEWRHDETWMFHLFNINVWYSYFILLFVLSVAGYACEKNRTNETQEKVYFNLQDHIFFTIAIASSQGWIPTKLQNKSRIIYLCTSMFSWLILIAFSSHAIYLMMNKKFVLPFTDLRELIQESNYDVIAFSGSMVQREFKETVSQYYKYPRDKRRVTYASAASELFKKVCFSKKRKLAGFEAEDRHKAIGKNICRLVPAETSYFETWIASAITRGFRYKRSFDTGILRMFETGLIDGLKDRWLDWKTEDNEEIPFQSIDMSQVYCIFGILALGATASVIILFVEYVIFFKNKILISNHINGNFQTIGKSKIITNKENHIFFLKK